MNTASAKRAKLRFTRTGPTTSALTVNFVLPTTGLTSPLDLRNLIATYGNTGSGDYTLTSVTAGATLALAAANSGGNNTLSIPAGATEAIVDVVPRADNLTEANVVRADLAAASTYALGPKTRADVFLYDGPLWTVLELTGPTGVTSYQSAGQAVNAGVATVAGGWTVPPQGAGTATWNNLYNQAQQHGALWTSQAVATATDLGLTFIPYGISFRASTASADRAKLVGTWGSSAYQVLDDNTGGVTLPHFGTNGPSAAWGISPDGGRTVGYSTSAGKIRPARWVGTNTPVDLSSGLEDPMNQRIGEAKAVNNAGVIVGYSSGFLAGGTTQRPFRNTGNGNPISDADGLDVPAGSGAGTANAVTTAGTKHYAAGWYRLNVNNPKVGVLWSAASAQTLPSVATGLGRLNRNGVLDDQSEAKSINSSLTVVGWSGPSETDSNRRAVFHAGGAWKDLNDKHFIHGSTGWVLQSANAISDTGVIVGVGTLSTSPRGFMLISRVPGN